MPLSRGLPMAHNAAERAARKRLLQARSAVLRLTLSHQLGQGLQPALHTLDRADSAWRWLKAHPLVWLGAGAAVLVWRPRGVPVLAGRVLGLWQLWRQVAPVAQPLLRRWLAKSPRSTPP